MPIPLVILLCVMAFLSGVLVYLTLDALSNWRSNRGRA